MVKLYFGYLLKKEMMTYGKKEVEVYELCDYVAGMVYESEVLDDTVMSVLTGKYIGCVAETKLECSNYCILLRDANQEIEENYNMVNFVKIREKKLQETAKYYYKKNKRMLRQIKDEKIIKYLENGKNIKEKLFYEQLSFDKVYQSIIKTVIGQDVPISKLLASIFTNQSYIESKLNKNRIHELKENILLVGSTGVGKTEIARCISKLIKLPVVVEDATTLLESNANRRDVSDMLEDLYKEANKNIKLAESGILIIDNFDRIREENAQKSLIRLFENSDFYLKDTKFNTSCLTVMGIGTFSEIATKTSYDKIDTEDYVECGIDKKIMLSFLQVISMNDLDKDKIIDILVKSDISPINVYATIFENLGIGFECTEKFVEYIADKVIEKQVGARSLKSLATKCFSKALFELSCSNEKYSKVKFVKPQSDDEDVYILF